MNLSDNLPDVVTASAHSPCIYDINIHINIGTSLIYKADHCHHTMFGLILGTAIAPTTSTTSRTAFPTLAGSLMSTNPNGGFLVVSESQLCVSLLS